MKHERALNVTGVEDPRRFGVVRLRENGSVAEIVEKPEHSPSNLVSTGVFLLDAKIFEYEPDRHADGE